MRTPPVSVNFDGIAGQVEQHLTQPALVAEDVGRVGGDGPDDLQPLFMGARAQQFGDAAHQTFQIDGAGSNSSLPASRRA